MKRIISALIIFTIIGTLTSVSTGTARRDPFSSQGLIDQSIGKGIEKIKKSLRSSSALTTGEDVCLSQTSLACEDACRDAEQQCGGFRGVVLAEFTCDPNDPGNSTGTCEIID